MVNLAAVPGRKMTAPKDTRIAEVQLRVEETREAVDMQQMVVQDLQRQGQDATEEKRLF